MLIKIVYDNTTFWDDLQSDWGFAAVIEIADKRILFDAGADGDILMENMRKMSIEPSSVNIVFISHHHFDHTGGLSSFLAKNNKVTVYVPASLRGVRNAANVIHVDKAVKLGENLYSTGELKGIEQSLLIKTDKGVVVITGCSHPGLETILDNAAGYGKIHSVIGGFHGFSNFKILSNVDYLCPMHCTKEIDQIKKLFPKKCIQGGVGKNIEL